jgi:hypothetical protein
MSSDPKNPTFANMHFPGMKADPDEGRVRISDDAGWRLKEQIECIGEGAQRTLLGASAFLLPGNALATRLAKKLMSAGVGRIGVFGAKDLTGAHALGPPADGRGALPSLSVWAKQRAAWATLETFSSRSVDRQLEDMVRGFDLIVSCDGAASAAETIELATEQKRAAAICEVAGKTGWFAGIPSGKLCADCFAAATEESWWPASAAGFYEPTLDLVAAYAVADFVAEQPGGRSQDRARVTILDLSGRAPTIETRDLTPRSDCGKCR